MKITYRNMLNEAANLKIIHEKVEVTCLNIYLIYEMDIDLIDVVWIGAQKELSPLQKEHTRRCD